MKPSQLLPLCLAALLLSNASPAALPAFTVINAPPGYQGITPEGISGDGSTVVGTTGGTYTPFKWTATGGVVILPTIGGAQAIAGRASYDASVIVGFHGSDAAMWTNAGITLLPSITRSANGVSSTGVYVVGQTDDNRAFRWSSATGVVVLAGMPGTSNAAGVSADGSVVAGETTPFSYQAISFRWTQATGMVPLETSGRYSAAYGITPDGQIIFGAADMPDGLQPFRWQAATGMRGVGPLPNAITFGLAASDDGNVVVGYAQVGGQQDYRAIIWDPTHGTRYLKDVLTSAGINMTGYSLVNALAISANGKLIVGHGGSPNGDIGWIVNLAAIDGDCETRATALQAQVTDLQGQVATLTAQSATLQTQVATLTTQLAASQAQVSTLTGQVSTLTAQVTALTNEKAQLQSLITQLQGQLGSVTQQLQAFTTLFRTAFNDPTFQIPGTTPDQQLQTLLRALQDLNNGQLKALYRSLGGAK